MEANRAMHGCWWRPDNVEDPQAIEQLVSLGTRNVFVCAQSFY